MRSSPGPRRSAIWIAGSACVVATGLSGAAAQAASFTVSASPISQNACFNEEIEFTARVRTGDGYALPVKVTLPNPPSGFFILATAPNPVTPGPSGNVRIRVTKTGGPHGAANIVVRGTGSNGQTAQSAVLIDVQDVPGAPVVRLPLDGASVGTTPTLEWDSSIFAKAFIVQVSTDINFSDPAALVYETVVADAPINAVTVSPALASGQLYYWRVFGTNRCGDGFYSRVLSFVTGPTDTLFIDGME